MDVQLIQWTHVGQCSEIHIGRDGKVDGEGRRYARILNRNEYLGEDLPKEHRCY